VVEIANASMLRALRLVSVQRGRDLRRFALIAYGGAGPLHAGALARAGGISRVVVPAHSGVFSALGCLVSPLRYNAVQTCRTRLEAFDPKPIDDRFRVLEAECARPLLAEGIPAERVTVTRGVDLRYAGQNYELEVPYDADPARLRAGFEERHRQLYGYATGDAVECVNVRLTASVPPAEFSPAPPTAGPRGGRPELTGEARAFFPAMGAIVVPRYARPTLGPATAVDGPAVVEDEWSTTILYPGQRCRATAAGDLDIETVHP
jgi:N-methylhydantoinase A